MVNWFEWDDQKISTDDRFKLIFIRRFGQEESDWMEKGVFGRKGMESYSNMYMPILVDSDERPDIFIKYGIKSTPSVVITTKDGKIIAGGGTADYETFIKFMIELGVLINREKNIIEKIASEDLEEDTDEIFVEDEKNLLKQAETLADGIIDKLIKPGYFSTYWLLIILEYLLKKGNKTKAYDVVSILEKNEDKVGKGIFAGSTLENPTVFSTYKESFLNVKYARLLNKLGEEEAKYKEKSESILEFCNSMKNSEVYSSAFAEDNEYYKSTESIRNIRPKPKLNPRIFFNVNAAIASELCMLGKTNDAKSIMEKIEANLVEKKNGKIYKVYHSDKKDVSNLIIDIAYGAYAYSSIFRATGEQPYKEKTLELISLINHKKGKRLFFEFDPNGFGFIKKRKIDILGNIIMTKALENLGFDATQMKTYLINFIQVNPFYLIHLLT
ncbi:MAG: hypothetical protein NZ927_05915 [Candidatus Calescibacterium sp.]|nr:hypothetical protein [Candidatus Calescibacterium sp.]MCX7734569.1 hypothetical protein [bacterium]